MTTAYRQTAALLKVFAHPTRLQILDLLRDGELCVCHIERVLGKRQAYVSQHLMYLRKAGLVANRRDGLQIYYRLSGERTADLLQTLVGNANRTAPQVIAGCPCPCCSVVTLDRIE